jgi:hypothetical protein
LRRFVVGVKIKDPRSSVQFTETHLKVKVQAPPRFDEVTIDTWDCTGATGAFGAPTHVVTQVYLEDQNDPNKKKYFANTINNNDPGPGDWNACCFPSGMPSSSYLLWAVGDDGSKNSEGPFNCF